MTIMERDSREPKLPLKMEWAWMLQQSLLRCLKVRPHQMEHSKEEEVSATLEPTVKKTTMTKNFFSKKWQEPPTFQFQPQPTVNGQASLRFLRSPRMCWSKKDTRACFLFSSIASTLSSREMTSSQETSQDLAKLSLSVFLSLSTWGKWSF